MNRGAGEKMLLKFQNSKIINSIYYLNEYDLPDPFSSTYQKKEIIDAKVLLAQI